jgi:hypothetical protein
MIYFTEQSRLSWSNPDLEDQVSAILSLGEMLTQLYHKALGIKSVRALRTRIVDVLNINYNKHNKSKYMKIFMEKQSLF